MEETYLIQYDGMLCRYPRQINQRGFTYDEAISYIEKMQWKNARLISIKEEIEKYKLQGNPMHKGLFDSEVYDYETWRNAYMDNNINGIRLPIYINTNEEYIEELENIYKKYLFEINKPAFAYEDGLVSEVENTCESIIGIIKMLIKGDIFDAESQLKDMIEKFSVHPFFVNELDKSYSFRGIAPYIELQRNGHEDVYREMRNQELSFIHLHQIPRMPMDQNVLLLRIRHVRVNFGGTYGTVPQHPLDVPDVDILFQ